MNMVTRTAKFGRGGSILRSPNPLDNELILARTPAVFADAAHESRSDKYTYIPTVDILDGMRKEGFFPFEVRQGGSRVEGKAAFTKHMIRFRHANALSNIDGLFREIILLNSHDGTSSYQLMSGLFRMVCSNGLIISQGEAKMVKIAHRGDVVGRVIEGAYEIIDDSKDVDSKVNSMQAIELSPTEQEIFARSASLLRFDGEVPVTPSQVLTKRRSDDSGNDLWTVFNRVQENLVNGGLSYIQRDATGRRVAHRRTRPVQAVDGNVKLNQALWTLTAEMQKLKA